MKKFAVFAMVTIGIAFAVTSIRAATLDPQSIVYIECTVGGKISKGSGVVVGDDGRILTAKHVVPDGSECRGVRGTGATTPTRGLILGKKSAQYDARILKFVPNNGEKFEPAAYAKLTKEMQGRAITAYGFPLNGTGQLSVRRGSIATTITDQNGLIQTVALTAKGMSGGPVFLDNGKMIGIVSGVRLDRRATPTDFAVLAAQDVATELELRNISRSEIEAIETNGLFALGMSFYSVSTRIECASKNEIQAIITSKESVSKRNEVKNSINSLIKQSDNLAKNAGNDAYNKRRIVLKYLKILLSYIDSPVPNGTHMVEVYKKLPTLKKKQYYEMGYLFSELNLLHTFSSLAYRQHIGNKNSVFSASPFNIKIGKRAICFEKDYLNKRETLLFILDTLNFQKTKKIIPDVMKNTGIPSSSIAGKFFRDVMPTLQRELRSRT